VTSNTGTSVQISWSNPYNGGSSITSLSVEIRTADGVTFSTEPLYCNADSDVTVMDRGYCVIPMSVLTASPFSLAQGDLVVARLSASNVVGASTYSDESIDVSLTYADVRAVPHTPPNPPSRGDLTSTDTIEVVIEELSGDETGGDTILSYHIEYDAGTSGLSWTELQGYTSNSLKLSVVHTGLTISTSYQVRYRTRNQFGWSSGYSDVATISTVTEPGKVDVASISATIAGTNIVVSWDVPASNGSPILTY
jgi:hypothetical protein